MERCGGVLTASAKPSIYLEVEVVETEITCHGKAPQHVLNSPKAQLVMIGRFSFALLTLAFLPNSEFIGLGTRSHNGRQ